MNDIDWEAVSNYLEFLGKTYPDASSAGVFLGLACALTYGLIPDDKRPQLPKIRAEDL